ncbi:unnamed protein product [Fraxinus pennsylvanica]|uniref:Uncharacterized protein n=1 Tax=Fraxinus pennsylvanica TaxID=56036 RepID=A0AAD1ZQR9_9LAMI|nr:unnamed protein product [Fraxinus pennsylvanica]
MPTRVGNKSGVKGEGCMHGMSCVDSPADYGGDRSFPVVKKVGFKDVEKREKEEKRFDSQNSASESSSIGKNSDISEKSLDNLDEEVQSSYKGPLDAMDALEEVLPIRRGISRFYNGKSKSFASLADASSSSIKNLSKPENAYTRKRRNLLVCSIASWDVKNRSSLLRSNGGGISKRMTNSSRTTLALAVAMSNSGSDKHPTECNSSGSSLSSPRKDFPVWRSFSLADLQESVQRLTENADYSSSTINGDTNLDDSTRSVDEELRRMLTTFLVDNGVLRKQVNSTILYALQLKKSLERKVIAILLQM